MNQQYVKMDILFNSKREEKLKSHRFCIRQKKMGVGGREACFDRLKKSVAIHVQLFTLIIRPLEKKTYYIRFQFLILHLKTEVQS